MAITLESMQRRVAEFRDERDWAQFHSPKNLAMALSVEAGELLELFLWRDDAAPLKKARISEEMADVLIYLLSLADVIEVDLEEAIEMKLVVNAKKYPADLVRGKAEKYSDYQR